MIIELPFSDFSVVTSVALAFAVGMVSVIIYNKLSDFAKRGQKGGQGEAVIEAIVSEYSRRLKDYDRVIGDLRTKIDVVEMRAAAQSISTPEASRIMYASRQVAPHIQPVSEPVTVTQHAQSQVIAAQVEVAANGHNGTNDYILKLLVEKPRSSREIQHSIGRTREHTARLLKKLYEQGLVSRDVNSKPFKYGITDAGRMQLRTLSQSSDKARQDAGGSPEAQEIEQAPAAV